jgi:hypothetical protein
MELNGEWDSVPALLDPGKRAVAPSTLERNA